MKNIGDPVHNHSEYKDIILFQDQEKEIFLRNFFQPYPKEFDWHIDGDREITVLLSSNDSWLIELNNGIYILLNQGVTFNLYKGLLHRLIKIDKNPEHLTLKIIEYKDEETK